MELINHQFWINRLFYCFLASSFILNFKGILCKPIRSFLCANQSSNFIHGIHNLCK
nr:MAG TPA: hypothetical protein [Caudoviricetes sp.]